MRSKPQNETIPENNEELRDRLKFECDYLLSHSDLGIYSWWRNQLEGSAQVRGGDMETKRVTL